MILQRYIFRELILTFAVAFAILVAVCSVGLIFNMFRSAEGIALSLIFDALPVAFSYMAPWALIVASTLSATMVYGRLAAENEIDAMRTSGIHMGRIVAPALLYAVVIFVLGFFTQHELAPWARFHRRGIIGETVISLLRSPPGGYQNIKVSSNHRLIYLDAREGEIVEPTVVIFNDKGELSQQFHGDSGSIRVEDDRTVHITIRRGSFIIWEATLGGLLEKVEGYFDNQSISVKLDDPYAKSKGPEDMRGLELVSSWSLMPPGSVMRNVYYTELHLRFAKTLGPLCLILLAIPIGVRVKKGTKMSGLGMAIPPLLVYFILFFIGQSLAQRNHVAPEVGAYGPNAVILVAALALMWKVFRL
jgi:lipopolysaccharide export system permease protein